MLTHLTFGPNSMARKFQARWRTPRWLICWLLLFGCLPAKEEPLLFERDVRPILKAQCFHCHGEDSHTEADLDLRLRKSMVKGGESGPVIVPQHPDDSLIVEKIESGEMPPEGKQLSVEQKNIIRRWIKEGARTARPEPDSITDDYLTPEEKSFWSFQPIIRPSVPGPTSRDPSGAHRSRNGIDRFIGRKLTEQGLSLSQQADRRTLIRRAYYDLLGIPPEPDEVSAFLADKQVDAYERLIDRLLGSPRYGERWGRHWLDVAGYADSEGYSEQDPEREFAFFYRDYVIESFNQGKPFDRFVMEQLAGDELVGKKSGELSAGDRELLTATGFLRMAPDGTATGGTDRDIAANETVAETINIVSTSLLGLTVGCARCHNHRYDPIRQVDYYRMRAVFEPALDWKRWKTPAQRRISLYTDRERAIRSGIEAKAKEMEKERTRVQAAHLDRTLEEELLVAPDGKRDSLRKAYRTPKDKRTAEQAALLEEFPNIQNISNGSLYLYAEQRARRAREILAEADRRERKYVEEIRASSLEQLDEEQRAQVQSCRKTPMEKRTAEQQALAARYPGAFVDRETLKDIDPRAAAEIQKYRQAAEKCRNTDAKTDLAQRAAAIAKLRTTAPKEYFVRALVEPENYWPDTFLFKRGSHKAPAQKVLPGELEVLRELAGEIPVDSPDLPTTGRRLAFARNLVSGRHPLVPRVIVNRIWFHHFGRGLVETPGDFGYLGSRPTHPDLLDWLASEFMQKGWDIKHLHRLIMTSETYCQSSFRSPEQDRIDPDNRWYGRQSIRRLESEAIRDSILAVSGMLVNRMGGAPVPVKEDAVGQIVLGKQKLDGERKPTPGNNLGAQAERRSVYIQVRRSRPLAVLESFDIATTTPNCTRRSSSNVAPQALMLMNSPFMIRYANRMTDRVRNERPTLPEQITRAYFLCFCRQPDAEELSSFIAFVRKQTSAYRESSKKLSTLEAEKKALANLCHAFLSANEFIYID